LKVGRCLTIQIFMPSPIRPTVLNKAIQGREHGYVSYGSCVLCCCSSTFIICYLVEEYEGRLLSNAHSEMSRKREHVFKQTKVGSKVQYFSYKLTYLFFDLFTLSFNTFFATKNKFSHAVSEEFRSSLFDPRHHSLLNFII
jgi:hypothetical protein